MSAETSTRYAHTWDALAQRLGVTRRAIQDWRNDERLAGFFPKPRADGRHDVQAWQAFMLQFGLKGAGDDISTDEGVKPPKIGGSIADWKKSEVYFKVEERQIEIQKIKGTLLVASDLELPLGAIFAAIQNKMTQFPDRLAPQVIGFSEVYEVAGIIRAEMEADLSDLNTAEYLTAGPLQIAQSLPFDEETARLMDELSFSGQDRAKLIDLIAICAMQVVSRIGRAAVARVLNHKEPVEELPLQAPYDPNEDETSKPAKKRKVKP